MRKLNKLRGFTLAEVLITLVILGVVAAITVPSLLKKQTESANRTKIKKAWNVYDTAIQRMVIENNIKTLEGNTDSSLKGWGNKEVCPNTTAYFKKAEEETGCKFKTSDGLYWDISKIEEPVVALTKEARDNFSGTVGDDNNVFQFYTSFNENSGAFTTNDVPRVKDATASANLEKFFKFIKPEIDGGNGGGTVDSKRACSDSTKNEKGKYVLCREVEVETQNYRIEREYDANGNNVGYYECGPGKSYPDPSCDMSGSEIAEYDQNNNIIAYRNDSRAEKFIYNDKNQLIKVYRFSSPNANFETDTPGVIMEYTYNADGSFNSGTWTNSDGVEPMGYMYRPYFNHLN